MKRLFFFLAMTLTSLAMTVTAQSATVASGTCGDNLTWVLTDDGVLTISGTGKMTYFPNDNNVPWYLQREQINTIIINDGCSEIGINAFYNCINLTSISIPESVLSIGNYAFFLCSSLASITFPQNLTKIGNYAFLGCTSLTSIIFPQALTEIGNYAFNSCSINTILIPPMVRLLGYRSFYNCNNLTTIYWNTEVAAIDKNLQNSTAEFVIGANLKEVKVWDDAVNTINITYLNPTTRLTIVSTNAPATPSALYDMDGDGIMEFAAYTKESNNVYKINRYSNVGAFEGTEITANKAAYQSEPEYINYIHSNNDGQLDYLYPYKGGTYLYESNSSDHILKMIDAEPMGNYYDGRYGLNMFCLDADLNGRTDLYTYEGAGSYGYGGTPYIYYRQADGSYLKTELQILIDTAEVNSALNDAWTTSGTGGPMITALENSLREYMFLPENTERNPYAMLDAAIDIDQNGLVDLLSTTSGALLLNVGNDRYVQCKFPGNIIVKDLNNDNIPDYIIYNNTNKIVSLQISNTDGTISTQTLFQGMAVTNIWCYDFDNDGDVDILIPYDYTTTAGYAYLVFFRNDGNNTFKKIENAFEDPVYHFAFVDCKDVDNDGLYEIIAADSINGSDYYVIEHNNRFKTSVSAEPFIKNSLLPSHNSKPDLLLGDFDNDGKFDYWYAYLTKDKNSKISTNHCFSHFTPATLNTAPAKMSTPVCVLDTARKMIRLSWNRGSDTESPNMDLEYSIRIGSTSGASDIWFAAARADGKQRNILGGNVGTNLSQWVNVADWPVGDYYIAVQAIDPNGLGGAWSDELIYHHSIIGADFHMSTLEMTTADTLTVQFSGTVNPNYTYSWNFGDSAIIIEQNTTTQYYKLVYDSPGQKVLSLQVTDGQGNASEIETRNVLVYAIKYVSTGSITQSCLDMNMDGYMDVLRTEGLFKGNADGTITKVPKTFNSNLTFSCFNAGGITFPYNYANAMSFIDYNMDGLPDIVEKTNKGTVFLNEEDFDFDISTKDFTLKSQDLSTANGTIYEENVTNCSNLKWRDFDNDGWMDVYVSNAVGRVSSSNKYASINYGTEDRTSFTGGFKDSYLKEGILYNRYVGLYAYWGDWKSYIADFNRDGYDDILTCFTIENGGLYNSAETYHIYLNAGEDRFVRSAFVLPNDVSQRVDGIADIDNDGYIDLLFVKNAKTLLVLLGDAELSYVNRVELRLPAEYQLPTSASSPLSGCSHDFDNNGYPDIVTSNGGLLYVHPNYQITPQPIPTSIAYPFVDLNNDGIPDINGYNLQSRITNQAPAVPQNLRVTEENGAVKLEWDAAIDRETPTTQMRYNISVRKKGASVGQDSAFIISPMNGLYDEAAIVPDYPYKRCTQMYIPYRRFEIGQEYEFQIQSIDGWNAHSPMSAPLTFTVQKNTTAPVIETPTLVESITLTNISGGSVLSQRNPQIIVEATIEPDSAANKQLYWGIVTGSNKVTIEPDSNRCTITMVNDATPGEVVLTVRALDGSGVSANYAMIIIREVYYTIEFYHTAPLYLLQSIQVKEGDIPVYTGPTPTIEPDEQYEHIVNEWISYDSNWNMVYGLQPATADKQYYADFIDVVRRYTVTFLDWNGSTIDSQEVAYGESAIAPVNPEREGYTFTGWDKDFSHVEGDMVITAQYEQNSTPITYTILFVNWDNALLQTLNITEGELPVYTEATPTRQDDEQYTYTFIGWTPEIVAAIADATYTATYEAKDIHEGLEDIDASSAPRKIVIDNVIYILRGDHTYTLTGQEVR